MCGRFALGNNHEEIFANLIRDGVLPADQEPEWVDESDFYPRYNVTPQVRPNRSSCKLLLEWYPFF
jgi:hypothetical protein